jgi:hypothetical protein
MHSICEDIILSLIVPSNNLLYPPDVFVIVVIVINLFPRGLISQ